MTQPRTLHELYQLLWEQIKDKKPLPLLVDALQEMYFYQLISESELNLIAGDVFDKYICMCVSDRKAFVLRMIEETKND